MSALPNLPNHKTRRAALKLDRLGPDLPPPERRQHDPVALVEERDPDGWPVRHCRTVDTIGRLVRSGLVRSEWAVAADRFRRDYRLAAFDPLSANDLGRARGGGGHGVIMDRVEDARQRLADAIAGMGGLSAPAGSIVWHVIGAELTLKDWSMRQVWGGRPLRQEVATGFQTSLKNMDLSAEKIAADDRASARNLEASTHDWVPGTLMMLLTGGFFGLIAYLASHDVPVGNRDLLNIMLGSLGTAWTGGVTYYYGSSVGAAVKDKAIGALMQR